MNEISPVSCVIYSSKQGRKPGIRQPRLSRPVPCLYALDPYPAMPLLGNLGLALSEQIRVFNVQI